MIISTRGRYGLRAMFELAKAYGEGPLSLKQISGAQNLSEQYLEQIFSKLKNAGLVISIRGASGGYKLGAKPGDISVGSVLTALEGEMSPAQCVGGEADCENMENCVTHIIWQRIYDGFKSVVDSITLEDMLGDYERLMKEKPQAKDVRC